MLARYVRAWRLGQLLIATAVGLVVGVLRTGMMRRSLSVVVVPTQVLTAIEGPFVLTSRTAICEMLVVLV